jgi:hypothetical protein
VVELVVQYPGDFDWWTLASVADGAVDRLTVVAKTAEIEGAQTAIKWAGIMFTVDEFVQLRGGKVSTAT